MVSMQIEREGVRLQVIIAGTVDREGISLQGFIAGRHRGWYGCRVSLKVGREGERLHGFNADRQRGVTVARFHCR